MDKIPNWTKSRMDKIPNGQNPEWTKSRMDKIQNGQNPELDKIQNLINLKDRESQD